MVFQKRFGSRKVLGPEKFWSKHNTLKMLGLKKKLGPKKRLGPKKFGSRKKPQRKKFEWPKKSNFFHLKLFPLIFFLVHIWI